MQGELWYMIPLLHAVRESLGERAIHPLWKQRLVNARVDFNSFARTSCTDDTREWEHGTECTWLKMIGIAVRVTEANPSNVASMIPAGNIKPEDVMRLLAGPDGTLHRDLDAFDKWIVSTCGTEDGTRLRAAWQESTSISEKKKRSYQTRGASSAASTSSMRTPDTAPTAPPRTTTQQRTSVAPCRRHQIPARAAVRSGRVDMEAIDTAVDKLLSYTTAELWSVIDGLKGNSRVSIRRRLPGTSPSDARCAYSATVATVVIKTLLERAERSSGDDRRRGDIAAFYAPLIFLKRGVDIGEQVQTCANGELLNQALHQVVDQKEVNHDTGWVRRINAARECGDTRRVITLLEQGPSQAAVSHAAAVETLDALYPPDVSHGAADPVDWDHAAEGLPECSRNPVTPAALISWARRHRQKSGDGFGWSAQLLVDIHTVDHTMTSLLASLFSKRPGDIGDVRLRREIFRSTNGHLLPQQGKTNPRPIAAPSLVRRIASATAARAARSLTASYCQARGHVGLSAGSTLLAYSMLPAVVVRMGGTVVTADRSNSFQTFTREALLRGVDAALREGRASGQHAQLSELKRAVEDFWIASDVLPRTHVEFKSHRENRVVEALPQGCSLSPTLQSLALACATDHVQESHGKGTIVRSAHDDLFVAGDKRAAADDFILPTPVVGGTYNASKSIAIGALADVMVQKGVAACKKTYTAIFGVPVGDVDAWMQEVWMGRVKRVMHGALKAAEFDPAAAFGAMHLIGGPGGMARHWLRCTPVTGAQSVLLREVDDQWVETLISIAGGDGVRGGSQFRMVKDRVFGKHQACLSHSSAEDEATVAYKQGMKMCWDEVCDWVDEAEMDIAEVAKAMGAPRGVTQAANIKLQMALWIDEECEQAVEAREEKTSEAGLRAGGGLGVGARDTGDELGRPNLLIAALSPAKGVLAGPYTSNAEEARLLLCITLGIPIWQPLRTVPPCLCPVCGMPLHAGGHGEHAVGDGEGRRRSNVAVAEGEADVDHVYVCKKAGRRAGAKWRHDVIVSELAKVSEWAGCGGRYHDQAIFEEGPNGRPADFIEVEAGYPAGGARDVTMGLRRVMSANAREDEKRKKYVKQMMGVPLMNFKPLGFELSGQVGSSAWDIMQRWVKHRLHACARGGVPPGDVRAEVVCAVGRILTRSLGSQVAAWVQRASAPMIYRAR
jgi:hypothetical protein